jgi:hypothetical protein
MDKSYQIKIYSIGASDEEHGPAISKNIDDIFSKKIAVEVAQRLGADYRGHFPYSTDMSGDIARDWNHTYMSPHEIINLITADLKADIQIYKETQREKFSHIIIISGHGGNNALEKDISKLSKLLKTPVLYVPPLSGGNTNHPLFGKIKPCHAGSFEHSIAFALNLLNESKFLELQKNLNINPLETLKKHRVIMSLAGYSLPELDPNNKFEEFRKIHPKKEARAREVLKQRSIFADKNYGNKLMGNIINEVEVRIKNFISNN